MTPSADSPLEATRPVPSGGRFAGRVRVPPSKSLTNRYLNLALLARRPLRLDRPLVADDTERFLEALRALGFAVASEPGVWRIEPPITPPSRGRIDCGASGTMARFLTASLATVPGRWRLDGRDRLRERPVGALVEALRGLGAEIRWLGRRGYLPLEVAGGSLAGGATAVDAGESSQFLSALLMASPFARREVTLTVGSLTSAPYVDLTLEALAAWGVTVVRAPRGFALRPGCSPPRSIVVAGDDSAAAYPAAAATLTGGEVRLAGLARRSRQGDRRFLELLAEMGAAIAWNAAGELEVRGRSRLAAIDADLSAMPDQVPTLAVVAPFARGTTRIRNVAQLRLKESDRLAAVAAGLRRAGARVEVSPDGLQIPGVWAERPPPSEPVTIDTFRDHRIAMSFALLGLRRAGISIADPAVVGKSYPEFWSDLDAGLGRG